MVKVAIAGGSSGVGREVIDRILARGKHEVLALTRHGSKQESIEGVTWIAVDYEDQSQLSDALQGVHTVLSFVTCFNPADFEKAHINLIDACVANGVKRFAPSEWASRTEGSPAHYAPKITVRKYLEELNSPTKKLEYCLFQPGFFTNYFANGRGTTKHFHMQDMFLDLENRRVLQVGDGSALLTLTTVEDMAEVTAKALDYQGEWPTIGGIRGSETTVSELIAIAESIRGKFQLDMVSYEDSKAGKAELPWCPQLTYKGVPLEMREVASHAVQMAYMTSMADGAWSVSDEWNKLLPDYKFTSGEEYLRKVWGA